MSESKVLVDSDSMTYLKSEDISEVISEALA